MVDLALMLRNRCHLKMSVPVDAEYLSYGKGVGANPAITVDLIILSKYVKKCRLFIHEQLVLQFLEA